ncbi:MAG TPA: FemAB family XrtA/PEP-CTERM system-associated protein [Candidatus Krumholzibacteriaceae bacterium]|nr:FemAB family XrtA/PEP-CTERM system-associated protein [Candidatus Krumholzibacteriaceae bacterium]
MTTIRFYQDLDRERWDSYVFNHPHGTFFHLIGWKAVVERTFHHKSFYLIAESNGNSTNPSNSRNPINPSNSVNPIVGILPLFAVKSFLFGKSLVSLPFAAYGGILADNQQVTAELLDRAKELTRSEGLHYLELRNRNGGIEDLPSKELYVLFQREIFEDLESNRMAIPRKSRRMIRVGEKAGLTYEFGQRELVPQFYRIFARSYHRLGTPVFSIKLFKNLLGELKEQANILLVKNREGKPISSVLTFFYKDQVLPYFAGSLLEYRDLAPNDYMYWQLMKYGHEKGYRWFDFGRSKVDTGSYDFKRHWGFEPQPLPYQYFLNKIDEIPNISPANPKYQKKIEMWRKLPFWASQIIGPRIVKYIP